MEKKEIRRLMAQRKKEYTDTQFEQMSRKITARLRELPCYQAADAVFAYMDLPGEVKMKEFILNCREDGKIVAVPRIEAVPKIFASDGGNLVSARREDRMTSEMRFYRIDSFDDLEEGTMHIMEPDPDRCECIDREEAALIIMPGVAFDTDRNRIGYGGGFYDRYLTLHSDHPTAAVAYDFQIFNEIPAEEQDIRPQLLVTEKRIL